MPSEWISVKNRLPEKDQRCICRYVFNHREDQEEIPFYQVLFYYATADKPHFQGEGEFGMRMTHWAPLVTVEEAAENDKL